MDPRLKKLGLLFAACIALSPACGPQLKLPYDPLQLTLPQRSIEAIPGSDGQIQIAVDDITERQVLLSIQTPGGKPVLLRRSVREDDLIPFEVGRKQFYLHVTELRNLLTGKDFCVLEISSQPPTRRHSDSAAFHPADDSQQQPATIHQPASSPAATASSGAERLQRDAHALRALIQTPWVRQFLEATEGLPRIAPRKVYFNETKSTFYSEEAFQSLDPTLRGGLQERELDEEFYYNTKYGSPLAYARPLDILGQSGLVEITGKQILDFGYGTVGHLRLLASIGTVVLGVDVDPLLPALYCAPGDQGAVKGRTGRDGRVTLLDGRWPAEDEAKRNAGDGYNLFISKNTLKNGYTHPAQPVDPRKLVQLGVDDETFVRAVYQVLKPGGRALIYNLSPAPNPPDKPYIPWADGRCPFARELWEQAGFRVIAFDQNDDAAAREMGRALGWDKGESPMDLENNLFGTYTLVEKPGPEAGSH